MCGATAKMTCSRHFGVPLPALSRSRDTADCTAKVRAGQAQEVRVSRRGGLCPVAAPGRRRDEHDQRVACQLHPLRARERARTAAPPALAPFRSAKGVGVQNPLWHRLIECESRSVEECSGS